MTLESRAIMPEKEKNAISTVSRVFRFPVLGRLWKYVVAAGIYAALVVQFGRGLFTAEKTGPYNRTGELVIAGIIFGWLMSFRTQTAYARWWDGRGLWGQLVNETRNLVLKAAAYAPEATDRDQLGAALVRFAESLRDRLRLPRKTPGPHLPMLATGEVFAIIESWYKARKIDGFRFQALDRHAQELMNVCGKCEKIRATPLAASYRGLLRKGIAGYLLLLPWILNDGIGWTVPLVLFVSYAVVGLELIATSIEDPFGNDGDDLPIDEIVETIRNATNP